MARWDVAELYHQLLSSEFGFVPSGRHDLWSLYEAVQREYPALCDDSYLCSTNCAGGSDIPEWRHAVRKALGDLKRKSRRVSKAGGQGYWDLD